MSFKHASESRATQRQVKRSSDEGTKPAPWAVVTFRPGRDNRGRPCVYRRCFPFRDGAKARNRYLAECRNWPTTLTYVALVTLGDGNPPPDDGRPYWLESTGDARIVAAWKRQRKGVNRDADPYLSGTYMHRELRGEVKFAEEGRR